MISEYQNSGDHRNEQEADYDDNEKMNYASSIWIYLGIFLQLVDMGEEHVGSDSSNHHWVKSDTQNREKCLIESHSVTDPKSILEENDDLWQIFETADYCNEDLLEPNVVATKSNISIGYLFPVSTMTFSELVGYDDWNNKSKH